MEAENWQHEHHSKLCWISHDLLIICVYKCQEVTWPACHRAMSRSDFQLPLGSPRGTPKSAAVRVQAAQLLVVCLPNQPQLGTVSKGLLLGIKNDWWATPHCGPENPLFLKTCSDIAPFITSSNKAGAVLVEGIFGTTLCMLLYSFI